MDQIHDQPLAGACAKGTLWGLTRTGGLILAAVLASIHLIDLPIPAREPEPPPYVPAAETWIVPGRTLRVDHQTSASDPPGLKRDGASGRCPDPLPRSCGERVRIPATSTESLPGRPEHGATGYPTSSPVEKKGDMARGDSE
jgi:hypothetical protein